MECPSACTHGESPHDLKTKCMWWKDKIALHKAALKRRNVIWEMHGFPNKRQKDDNKKTQGIKQSTNKVH